MSSFGLQNSIITLRTEISVDQVFAIGSFLANFAEFIFAVNRFERSQGKITMR